MWWLDQKTRKVVMVLQLMSLANNQEPYSGWGVPQDLKTHRDMAPARYTLAPKMKGLWWFLLPTLSLPQNPP